MDWNAIVLFTNWWSLMRTTLSYTIVSSTISNMLDYATLKMVQGNSETGRNVFKAPWSTMFPNIRFYLLCLFYYCLWIQVFPFTPPSFFSFFFFFSLSGALSPAPAASPPSSFPFSFSFFFSVPNPQSYCLLSSQLLLTLFHCSWCCQVFP